MRLRKGDLVATNSGTEEDFSRRYGPWAVIAGGSEGVGASLGVQLAERGVNVVLIARNGERLEQIAAELQERYGVETRTLAADLTSSDIDRRCSRPPMALRLAC